MKNQNSNPESVSINFDNSKLLSVQKQAWQTLAQISQYIHEGQSENDILKIVNFLLEKNGFENFWHAPKIRIGENTRLTFSEQSNESILLKNEDILFIDLGPVKAGYEADVGATFVLGNNNELQNLANASSIIFTEVTKQYRQNKLTGKELYQMALECADKMNLDLVTSVKGHRIADFPHHQYSKMELADFEGVPESCRWILEIQLKHRTQPYGSFYEDILLGGK